MESTSELELTGSEAEAPKQSEPKTTLLKEQGPILPVGIPDSAGGLHKDLQVRNWTFKDERALGALRDGNRDANVAQYISMVVGSMCSRLGQHDFENLKLEQKRVIISQMFMPDVFYAYVWLRRQALGNLLELDIQCPNCRSSSPFLGDLDTIEIKSVETEEASLFDYSLRHPFEVRGKKLTKLNLGPPRWSVMEEGGIVGSLNTGAAKAEVVRGSIRSLNAGDAAALTMDELDDMVKVDIEALTKLIESKRLGPDMSVKDKCGKCSYPITAAIDWGYDSFFGSSSQ